MANYFGTKKSEVIDPLNPEDDYIFGDSGNDTLYGWDGDDILEGWKGKDTLYGEAGDDYLVGGTGADKFAFNSPWEGIDTIEDFNYLEGDLIQIDSYGFGIGEGDYDYFEFDSSDGALYFDDTQIAWLQPNSGFDPSLDISIV